VPPGKKTPNERALRRCIQGGRAYWQAWSITLAALAISFSGLLALGVGFLVTSIWFWQVAGFSFASVFTQRFGLDSVVRGGPPHGAGGPDAGIDKCEE